MQAIIKYSIHFFKYLSKILQWVTFSPSCLMCEIDTFDNNILCNSCWSKLSFVSSSSCQKCGNPNNEVPCRHFKTHYSKVKAAVIYDENIAKLIYDFKYHDNEYMKKPLAKLMIQAGQDLIECSDIIIPVPLHINRLRFRKFNQAAALAQQISKSCRIRYLPQVLIRTKDTITQSGLTRNKRRKNMNEAFLMNQKYTSYIKDKRILLVDDVFTTGATANACAKILRLNGAHEVIILTIALTINNSFTT